MREPRRSFKTLLHLMMVLLGPLASLTPVLAQDAPVYILKASEWNVPRTTETILHMPALRHTIQAYNQQPKAKIQIHYPGGDEGTLWATELRSWLVSLGVASRHIELLPGSRKDGQLELQVIAPPVFARPGK
jgi:hypothetical protein